MNKTKNLERFCLRAVKVGLFFTLLAPLIYSPITISISTFSEVLFFRTIIEIIAVFWVALLLINWRVYLPRLSPILVALLVFTGSLTLSGFLGFNPVRSFLGTLSRQEGVLTYLHLLFFFGVLGSVFKEKKDWLKLFRTFVIVSIPVAMAGITQLFSLQWFKGIGCFPPECWRISATLGNSGFYGKYLMLVLFVSLFLLITEEKKGWKRFAIALMVLSGILLAINGTRAAWVGTALGAMIFGLGWFFLVWKGTFSRAFVRASGIFLVLMGLVGAFLFTQRDQIKDNIIFERARGLASDVMNQENPRFPLWKVGIKAWREHPILGTGLESFMSQYDRFNKPEFRLSRIPELENFDRAHNVFVDTLAMGGILGLLSYLGLFGAAFMMIARRKEEIGLMGSLALGSLFIASLTYNFFGFDLIVTHIPLFIILAFIVSGPPTPQTEPVASWNRVKTVGSLALGVFALYSIYTFNFLPFKASFLVVKANNFLNAGQVGQALIGFQNAFKGMNSWIDYDARRTMVKILHRAWQPPFDRYPFMDSEKQQQIREALPSHLLAMEMHLDRHGPDTYEMNTYLLATEGYFALYTATYDPQHLIAAKRVLQKALVMNPNIPFLHEVGSKIATLEYRLEDALAVAQKSYELFPDEGLYLELQGKAYAIAGRDNREKKRGIDLIRESLKVNLFYTKEKFQYSTIEQVAGLYRNLKEDKAIAELYEEAISFYPKDLPLDASLYEALEQAYKKLGQKKKAKEVAEKLKALQNQ